MHVVNSLSWRYVCVLFGERTHDISAHVGFEVGMAAITVVFKAILLVNSLVFRQKHAIGTSIFRI